jgi:hypothetical protein
MSYHCGQFRVLMYPSQTQTSGHLIIWWPFKSPLSRSGLGKFDWWINSDHFCNLWVGFNEMETCGIYYLYCFDCLCQTMNCMHTKYGTSKVCLFVFIIKCWGLFFFIFHISILFYPLFFNFRRHKMLYYS